MHLPSYLYRSRHSVFYFRWPLPRALHPLGKATTLKVSLGTCEPRGAIETARHLCYLSGLANAHPLGLTMNYDEMREFLRAIYAKALSKKKDRILATGRLSTDERADWKSMSDWAGQAVRDNDPLAQMGHESLE